MNTNEVHHLIEQFKKLKDDKKDRLLRLICLLYNHHPELFTENGNSKNYITNYPNSGGLTIMNILTDLFYNFGVFVEIYKLMNRTSIIKKMNKSMKELITNEDKLEKIRITFNSIILINLIRSQLEKKTQTQIKNYDLFNKLSGIDNKLILNIETIISLKDEEIPLFFSTKYNYTNCFEIIHSQLVQDNYFTIFELFSHFI